MFDKRSVVLIVDDDRFTRETLYMELKQYYSFFASLDSHTGIEILADFDLMASRTF
ncbi:MAG: hypothetical protein QGG87_00835 [Nitrospinota bacterium]|nr:hypothetical protein [Nitrospinota bacterium]